MCRLPLLIAALLLGVTSLGAQSDAFNPDVSPMSEITVDVPHHVRATVRLERMAVVNGATHIQAMREGGPVDVDPHSVAVYKGTLPDDPMSIVVVVHSEKGLIGSIHSRGEQYAIKRNAAPSSPLTIHAVKRTHAQAQISCSTGEGSVEPSVLQVMQENIAEQVRDKMGERTQENETLDLTLAVECDRLFFERVGMTTDISTGYVAQIVGLASAIYERDFNVRLIIGNLRVWESKADPYQDDKSINNILDDFIYQYENVYPKVFRHIGVFLTMRSGEAGIAKAIGGICQPGLNYCACDLSGDITHDPGVLSFDEILLAHELGHVCGAVHTQSCYWPGGPLDSCTQSERGTCLLWENTKASIGTVMSYCNQRRNEEGGGVVAEFHPRHKHVIRAYLERAACVGGGALKKNCTLRGRLINADNNLPVTSVQLHVRSYGNGLFFNPPITSSDTISVTDAEGKYEFNGLGDGVYEVGLPVGWTVSPISIKSTQAGVGVIVSSELVERDIRVVGVHPVTLHVETGGDATNTTFVIVSEKLSTLTESISVSGSVLSQGLPYVLSLATGAYTIVPHAVGRKFTPARFDFEVDAIAEAPVVDFTSTSTGTKKTAVSIAISISNVNGETHVAPGDTFSISNSNGVSPDESLITGINGVAVFENRSIAGLDFLTYGVDTNSWVSNFPIKTGGTASDPYPTIQSKRHRRYPLLARPYQLQVSNTPYQILENATRVITPELMGGGAIPVYLPFNIRIGHESISKMYVFPGGDIVLGNTPYNGFIGPPLTSYDDLTFSIAALGAMYRADSSALKETGVWWNISGVEPNREVGIEWRKVAGWICDQTNNCVLLGRYTFQVRIAESSGNIIMHYGEISPGGGPVPANIGLRGGDKLDMRILSSDDREPNWTSPEVRNTSNDSYNNLLFYQGNPPPNGLLYTWTQPLTSIDVSDEAGRPDAITSQMHFISEVVSDVIEIRGFEGASVSLVDVMGRMLCTSAHIPAYLYWDVSSNAAGLYMVLIEHNGTRIVRPVHVD